MTQAALGAPSNLVPPPSLVVIGGGWSDMRPATAAADPRLLKALPPAARVLELGSGSAALARAYKARNPSSRWTAVDMRTAMAARPDAGPQAVDQWCDTAGLDGLPMGTFDLLVVTDMLPWLGDAGACLRRLAALAAPEARLLLSVDNHASLGTLERILEGDLTAEARLSPADGQPRLMSPASVYKQLMDAGWMPTLADHQTDTPAAGSLLATVKAALAQAGASAGCPERVHGIDRMVIEARRTFAAVPIRPGPALFSVLVPTTQERQLRLNVEQSPGLAEVGARIVSYRGASSPAQAFEQGLAHADADWILLCHQDVYFPAGFGEQLNALLHGIPADERSRTLIGFVGLAAKRDGSGTEPAGFVIDRLHRADHPAADTALSIDELAIVMSRDSIHRIDPALGWHLWATDLCLASICTHQVFPRLVRLPLFHNSRTGWNLPTGFADAAHRLAAKWPAFGPIPTLCGTIDAAFLASHPKAAK